MKIKSFLPLLLCLCLLLAGCGQGKRLSTKISVELDQAVTDAILAENLNPSRSGECKTESHTILGMDQQSNAVIVYLMVMYLEYVPNKNGGFNKASGSHLPAALTFQTNNIGDYALTEYWVPEKGPGYERSIEEKFPASLQNDAMNIAAYLEGQQAECNGKADAYFSTRIAEEPKI